MTRQLSIIPVAGLTLLASACASGLQSDREVAFQACRSKAGTTGFYACTKSELAEAQLLRGQYAQVFNQQISDCEDKQAKSEAMGAPAKYVRCDATASKYVLDGEPSHSGN